LLGYFSRLPGSLSTRGEGELISGNTPVKRWGWIANLFTAGPGWQAIGQTTSAFGRKSSQGEARRVFKRGPVIIFNPWRRRAFRTMWGFIVPKQKPLLACCRWFTSCEEAPGSEGMKVHLSLIVCCEASVYRGVFASASDPSADRDRFLLLLVGMRRRRERKRRDEEKERIRKRGHQFS